MLSMPPSPDLPDAWQIPLHLVPTLQRMRVNLTIFRVVLNGYKTWKSPERHSGMFLAGIQGLESLLDPG
jgi:hypothetical protein